MEGKKEGEKGGENALITRGEFPSDSSDQFVSWCVICHEGGVLLAQVSRVCIHHGDKDGKVRQQGGGRGWNRFMCFVVDGEVMRVLGTPSQL